MDCYHHRHSVDCYHHQAPPSLPDTLDPPHPGALINNVLYEPPNCLSNLKKINLIVSTTFLLPSFFVSSFFFYAVVGLHQNGDMGCAVLSFRSLHHSFFASSRPCCHLHLQETNPPLPIVPCESVIPRALQMHCQIVPAFLLLV